MLNFMQFKDFILLLIDKGYRHCFIAIKFELFKRCPIIHSKINHEGANIGRRLDTGFYETRVLVEML